MVVFIVLHWQEAKNPFFITLAGFIIMFFIGLVGGEVTLKNA
jgi:hypothetical protein